MDILFFAFANDPLNPLPTLRREADELFRLLSPGEMKGHYLLYFDPFATREKLSYYLTQYKNQITLFHYSGHAGRDALATTDENSHAGGIAHLLGQCPKLNLVFLNGCSTQGQVGMLWEHGVSGIMATQAAVDDAAATNFSIRFYQALSVQDKLGAAFEQAKGDLLTQRPGAVIQMHRSIGALPATTEPSAWGLFARDDRPEVLDWQLPSRVVAPLPENYTPNKLLIDTLMESLAPYSRDVRNIRRDEAEGEEVDFADKRLAILNSLPAPIAEQLRKLMVPLGESDKGFDKIGAPRAAQLVTTYNTIIELFTYTLLAQLWDGKDAKPDIRLTPGQLDTLRQFFLLSQAERDGYDMSTLIRCIQEVMDGNGLTYFIEELSGLKNTFEQENAFFYASHYLEALKRRIRQDALAEHEVPEACRQGEQQLAEIFKELGFLARYTLAAVRMIDVVKYRHDKTARFRHALVRLVKLMGGLEERSEELDKFMDSRSVLLLKKTGDQTNYINISPFVIDENAFEERISDVSKVYFFNHYDKARDAYAFRHAYKPHDPPLVISNDKYEMVKLQFEAFSDLIFERKMSDL